MTISREKLWAVYNTLFQQKGLLGEMGAILTIAPETTSVQDFDIQTVKQTVARIVSYLMGVNDINQIPFETAMDTIQQAYKDQPFWKNILIDYFDFVLTQEKEDIDHQKQELRQEGIELLRDIQKNQNDYQQTIERFAKQIDAKQFPVNARQLVTNYFKMAASDPQQTWKTLTTNPAYFAPIQKINPKNQRIIVPDQAVDMNTQLAKFLEKLEA